ncbi:MAG: DUF3786 domain-containing protein [Desulfatibacillaceae bacterium]|nr:DUF3786 domain-containing protein [Desulfatibacillaceae bacterium]
MENQAPVFETVYKDYLGRLESVDLAAIARQWNLPFKNKSICIPLLGRIYDVGLEGVALAGQALGEGSRPPHLTCVTLFQYLLQNPKNPSQAKGWVCFRDFADAAPFVGGFNNTVERRLARDFEGSLDTLLPAAIKLGAIPWTANAPKCDAAFKIEAMPGLWMAVAANDADESFPASGHVFFAGNAHEFLDMESLAMLGMILVSRLKNFNSQY